MNNALKNWYTSKSFRMLLSKYSKSPRSGLNVCHFQDDMISLESYDQSPLYLQFMANLSRINEDGRSLQHGARAGCVWRCTTANEALSVKFKDLSPALCDVSCHYWRYTRLLRTSKLAASTCYCFDRKSLSRERM